MAKEVKEKVPSPELKKKGGKEKKSVEELYGIQVPGAGDEWKFLKKTVNGKRVIAHTSEVKAKEIVRKMLDNATIARGRVIMFYMTNGKPELRKVVEELTGSAREEEVQTTFTAEEVNFAASIGIPLEGLDGEEVKQRKAQLRKMMSGREDMLREGIIARERSTFKKDKKYGAFLKAVDALKKARSVTEQAKAKEIEAQEKVIGSVNFAEYPHLGPWIRAEAGIIEKAAKGKRGYNRQPGMHSSGGLHDRITETLKGTKGLFKTDIAEKMKTTGNNISNQLIQLEQEGIVASELRGKDGRFYWLK